jgi:hypothetical protein
MDVIILIELYGLEEFTNEIKVPPSTNSKTPQYEFSSARKR